jgi:hypothetical protein
LLDICKFNALPLANSWKKEVLHQECAVHLKNQSIVCEISSGISSAQRPTLESRKGTVHSVVFEAHQ